MSWQTIYYIIAIAILLFGTIFPTIRAFLKSAKKYKQAKTDADKETAKNEMLTAVNDFIVGAEKLFKGVDTIMKAQGQSTGALKKDSVMTQLQAFALSKGYEFDKEYWSKTVDDIVAMTREVNTTTVATTQQTATATVARNATVVTPATNANKQTVY